MIIISSPPGSSSVHDSASCGAGSAAGRQPERDLRGRGVTDALGAVAQNQQPGRFHHWPFQRARHFNRVVAGHVFCRRRGQIAFANWTQHTRTGRRQRDGQLHVRRQKPTCNHRVNNHSQGFM